MSKPIYTVKEVAELVGYHEESIRRLIREGEINAAQKGSGPYRISREELQRWWTEDRGGDPLPLNED